MQCIGCRFENMPGVAVCGRCGAPLHVAALAVDVHPPRASARSKRWRRLFPTFQNRGPHFSESWSGVYRSIVRNWDVPDGPAGPLCWRMVIPGWPQIYSGRIARGRVLLVLWACLLVSGAVMIGTDRGGILLGLAVTCHAASVLDVVLNGYERWLDRVRVACVTLIAVCLLAYLPAAAAFNQFASPQLIGQDSGALLRGDVLLLNQLAYRWASPAPGDVVIYNLPDAWAQGVRVAAGRRVDRVLATAGQHVVAEGGQFRVDGDRSRWLPLNPQALACSFDVTVPADHCLILPSTDRNITETVIPSVYLVPNSMIRGRVYLRLHPWNRLGAL